MSNISEPDTNSAASNGAADRPATSIPKPHQPPGVAGRLSKRCPNCNKVFYQRRFSSGLLEYPSLFKKKTYCSKICGAIANAVKRKLKAEQGA